MRSFHVVVLFSICHAPVAVAISVKQPVCIDDTFVPVRKSELVFGGDEVVVADRNGMRELFFKTPTGLCSSMSRVHVNCSKADTMCSQSDEVSECWDKGLLQGAFEFYTGGKHIHRTIHVGVGAGVTPTWIERHCPVADVQAADLSKSVFDALPLFGVTNTTRKHMYLQDGRKLVEAQKDNSVDIVFIDAMDVLSRVPSCLRTVEFFQTVYSKLVPGGVLAINTALSNFEHATIIGSLSTSFPMTHLQTATTFKTPSKVHSGCLNQFYIAVKPGGGSSRPDVILDSGFSFQPASQLHSGSNPIHDADSGCI